MSNMGFITHRKSFFAVLAVSLLWELWNVQPALLAPAAVTLEYVYIWNYHSNTARPAMRYITLLAVRTLYTECEHAGPFGWIFTAFSVVKKTSWRRRRASRRLITLWSSIIYFLFLAWQNRSSVPKFLLELETISILAHQVRFALEWGPDIGSDPLQNLRHNPLWTLILIFEILVSFSSFRHHRIFLWLEQRNWWYILCNSTLCIYLSAPRPPVMLARKLQFSAVSRRRQSNYICRVCRTAIETRYLAMDKRSRIQHHFWKSEIRKEAERGCRICATVWQYWSELPVTFGALLFLFWRPITKFTWTEDGLVLKIISQQTRDLSRRSCKFRIAEVKTPHALGHYSGHTASSATWSDFSIELARKWLSDCSASHADCASPLRDSEFFPTRMIRILDEGSSFRIYLHTSRTEPTQIQYATLSHCWGGNIKTRLLMGNMQALESGILLHTLPKSFLDAVCIAKDLGFSYIWIDSLCIIQDSIDDWNQEAPKMRSIYANSTCNIASTDAIDSSQGLVHHRDPRALTPQCIDKEKRLYLFNETDPFSHVLYSRAWVMQELLLARRTLHFGRSQIFWSCNGLRACDVFPTGIPKELTQLRDNHPANIFNAFNSDGLKVVLNARLLDNGFSMMKHYVADNGHMDMAQFPSNINERWWLSEVESGRSRRLRYIDKVDSALHPFNQWSILVETYTRMKLTKPTDRPVALSGLIALLRPYLGRYLAGLWRDFLPMELLWQTQITSTRSRQYRAPSWSWLSVEGPISYSRCMRNYMGETYMASVVEAQVEFEDEDAVTNARTGLLRIRGKLARGYWDGQGYKRSLYTVIRGIYAAEEPDLGTDNDGIHFEEFVSCTFPKIFFDEYQDVYDMDEDIYFLAIRRAVEVHDEDGEWVDGLVLRRSGSHGTFVRIGLFSDFGCQRLLPLFLSLPDREVVVV